MSNPSTPIGFTPFWGDGLDDFQQLDMDSERECLVLIDDTTSPKGDQMDCHDHGTKNY